MQPQQNAKLIYATRAHNPSAPTQLVFSITDEQGVEQIVTAQVNSSDLFQACQDNRWLATQTGQFQTIGRRAQAA